MRYIDGSEITFKKLLYEFYEAFVFGFFSLFLASAFLTPFILGAGLIYILYLAVKGG